MLIQVTLFCHAVITNLAFMWFLSFTNRIVMPFICIHFCTAHLAFMRFLSFMNLINMISQVTFFFVSPVDCRVAKDKKVFFNWGKPVHWQSFQANQLTESLWQLRPNLALLGSQLKVRLMRNAPAPVILLF